MFVPKINEVIELAKNMFLCGILRDNARRSVDYENLISD
jgi:hypothetical protein